MMHYFFGYKIKTVAIEYFENGALQPLFGENAVADPGLPVSGDANSAGIATTCKMYSETCTFFNFT